LDDGDFDQRHDTDGDDGDDADRVAQVAGDRILQGLQGASDPTGIGPTKEVSAPADAQTLSELVDKLADRVLVSQRSVTADSTVRIRLQQTVLQGSEITIHREQGELVVSLAVGSRELGEQLQADLGKLQSGLQNRLNEPVRVKVDVRTDSGDSQDRGTDGRDTDGDPGDGRSRNRRDPQEELEQPDDGDAE